MISDGAQPIYIYPDQLIKDTLPLWVESILCKVPKPEYSHSRGFQELLGSDDSTVRTRAFESYRIGLLLQRVISERASGAGMPIGWNYVCNDKDVLSKLGYLSYAVGKALSKNTSNIEIKNSLNILYLLFALSVGTENSGATVSTTLVYKRVLQCFRSEIGAVEFDRDYEFYSRWLAGAVFNTLDNPLTRTKLINEYIHSDTITSLVLERESDNAIFSVTAVNLTQKLSGQFVDIPEINKITRHKAALFWAAPNRGIYTNADLAGKDLLDSLVLLDRQRLNANNISILDSVLHLHGAEDHRLLEKLNDLLSSHIETALNWGLLMDKLSKGIYSALEYLNDTVEQVSKPKVFHLHGVVTEIPDGETEFFVKLKKSAMPITPDIGSSVHIKTSEYRVKSVSSNDIDHIVELELIVDPVLG